MAAGDVSIVLSRNEALILFNWLASFEERGLQSACDGAEQSILWKVEGRLESSLIDIFADNFGERVEQAKRFVTENGLT